VCVPSVEARELLGGLPDGIEVLVWGGQDQAPPHLDQVELLVAEYGRFPPSADALGRLPRLRVIQLLSAGVEAWLGHVPDGVTLCNGRGIHGASTAELALGGIISALREFPRVFADQRRHEWATRHTDGLDGKQVLVLGAGDIGRRIAAAVELLGAEVTVLARTAREGVHAMAELPRLLPLHQIVVVAVPRTPETEGLVGAEFLAAMPDGALFVNIARGQLVDTDALLAELTATRLSAFLDVTDPEPLPADHPLWDAPNLILTPHVGGGTAGWDRRAYRLVREQVLRLHRGEPLANVVTDGY
jgi:phosphoglycerate dehydrogenase-like enzyme